MPSASAPLHSSAAPRWDQPSPLRQQPPMAPTCPPWQPRLLRLRPALCGCPWPGVTGGAWPGAPPVAAGRWRRADGGAGRADNPLIPSGPREPRGAEPGHGGHPGARPPPALAALPGGTGGTGGAAGTGGAGWGCQARLGVQLWPGESPLTVLPPAVLRVWLQLLPRAPRVHRHPHPLHTPARLGLHRVLPHAVQHRGPGRQGEGDGGRWDTQGPGSARGTRGTGGPWGAVSAGGAGGARAAGGPRGIMSAGDCRGTGRWASQDHLGGPRSTGRAGIASGARSTGMLERDTGPNGAAGSAQGAEGEGVQGCWRRRICPAHGWCWASQRCWGWRRH